TCPRSFDHALGDVHAEYAGAQPGQAPGELPVAAGNVEDPLPGTDVEQALLRGLDQGPVEGVAFAHPLVPEGRILVPDVADRLVQGIHPAGLGLTHGVLQPRGPESADRPEGRYRAPARRSAER